MKKIVSLFLMLIILIVSVVSVNGVAEANDPNYPDYVFSVESGANDTTVYGVYKYSGVDSNVTIPISANEYSVKYIDEKAFYKNQNIKRVVLNKNITQIRQWSFRNCPELRYVYCPESLSVVWKYAFAYSPNIENMLLNHTQVENFYEAVFMNVSSLKYVSLPPTTKSVGYACFSGTSVEFVNIPDGTEILGNSVFTNNPNLKKVYIPASATIIGTDLFVGSENVTVYCEDGSTIHQYCIDNNVKFNLISKEEFPTQLLGDVNNSGDVDINDVTTIQKELALFDTEFNVDNCDVNKDCRLDIRDVSHLQNKLANIDNLS